MGYGPPGEGKEVAESGECKSRGDAGCSGQSRGRNPCGRRRASASPGRPIERERSYTKELTTSTATVSRGDQWLGRFVDRAAFRPRCGVRAPNDCLAHNLKGTPWSWIAKTRGAGFLPMNSPRFCTRRGANPPQTPGISQGCQRRWFIRVFRSHRSVVRWRQPRSTHLPDGRSQGCHQLADASDETTRRREPRGGSCTIAVSPTGSIPCRENPAWQVTNDKDQASRTKLTLGQ
jgi:hypothetical protein